VRQTRGVGTLLAVARSPIAAAISRPDAGYRPFIALLALLVLMGIARLSFGPRRRGAKLPPGSRRVVDLGLLVPLRTLPTSDDAELLRSRLRDNGVRASVSVETHGYVVLVFRHDEPRAREILQSQ
jgi:hypothetical protein